MTIHRAIEKRKSEQELKNSEERLRILFEFAPDAYYLNDLKGRFIDGNKAAEEISKNKGILYDPKVTDACLRLFYKNDFRFKYNFSMRKRNDIVD